ncbi:PulJ/GspJ family protein [Maridesulfovibrio frigidus]|uniref:PulJ/GspJ family protein n=1 Tax=Maridesulfovibrio frigidus TaxID=340956 RepID=UPI0004E17CE8|nr:prepilin-type N-terminal cleavage/methylation domain-containing protein [Maridesulfovibrio frigidus]
MISSSFINKNSHSLREGGFSLIEVLVGLILSGLLMSMVAMVLGQSITNNEVVRSNVGLSSRMFTLRRILHRDLQNRVIGGILEMREDGFKLVTSNNSLEDGAVPVNVFWDLSGNMIRRHEDSDKLSYASSFQLMRGVSSWTLEILDGRDGTWISALQLENRPLNLDSVIKAIRLNLVFEDGQRTLIVERIPYAFE